MTFGILAGGLGLNCRCLQWLGDLVNFTRRLEIKMDELWLTMPSPKDA